jgi:hypothetical protein
MRALKVGFIRAQESFSTMHMVYLEHGKCLTLSDCPIYLTADSPPKLSNFKPSSLAILLPSGEEGVNTLFLDGKRLKRWNIII